MNSLVQTPKITHSALLPSVCQNHVATGVLLVLGTNTTSNLNTHAPTTAETTRMPAVQRGRLDRHRRSDWPRQFDRPSWAVEPAWVAAPPRRVFGLVFLAQPSNLVFSGEPLQTPRTRCSLRQSPLMTRLPRSPGSTLVLRLYQETVHYFILLFMLPCGTHLTPLATGSLERSLLVFSTPGGPTGDDLSRLFFICTNTSQAATRTCNT
jgi:hypothetical protein